MHCALWTRLSGIFLVSVLLSAPLFGQPEELVQVGRQPLAIVPVGDVIHVFCGQVDLNFNAVQDDDDEPAAWYVLDAASRSVISSRSFSWGAPAFPMRTAYDSRSQIFYLCRDGRVESYASDSQNEIEDEFGIEGAVAVSVDEPQDRLIVSVRNSDADDEIVLLDLTSRATQRFPALGNVQQSVSFDGKDGQKGIAVLNEGNFGQDDSKLQIITPGQDPEVSVIDLGNTGNHLLLDKDNRLLVTMNGSHTIHVIDLEQKKIERSIATGTEGTNGPRETLRLGEELFVTTYNSDLRRIDYESGELIAVLESGGKPEGLAFAAGRLWVANAFENASFTVAATVAILHPALSTEVSEIVQTGVQPLGVFHVGEHTHIFCTGLDANFNGIQDEGDVAPAWYQYERSSRKLVGSRILEWGSIGFPFRPGLDYDNSIIYFSHLGRIRSFSLENLELLNDEVLPGPAAAVSVDQEGRRLFVSRRVVDGTGFVVEFDLQTEEQTNLPAGKFVQQTLAYSTSQGGAGLAILNEGDFGTETSTLQIVPEVPGPPERLIELGGTGNHLFQYGDLLLVTMNGSHSVQLIDLTTFQIVRTIPTQTLEFDGPRESLVLDDYLFVSTYTGDVRRFDLTSGELLDIYQTGGRTEGLGAADGEIWVANEFEPQSFTPQQTVAIIRLEPASTVRVAGAIGREQASIAVYPHPISDRAVVSVAAELLAGERPSLRIFRMDGSEAATISCRANADGNGEALIQIDRLALSSGPYMLNLQTKDGARSIPIIVRR